MASVELITNYGIQEPRLIIGDWLPLGHEVLAADTIEAKIAALGLLRSVAGILTKTNNPDDRGTACDINATYFEYTGGRGKEATAGRDLLSWIADSTDDELKKFLARNNDQHTQLQEALDRDTEELQSRATDGVERLVGMSLFPEVATSLLAKALETAGDLHAIDHFEVGGLGADGQYLIKPDQKTGLANLFRNRQTFKGINGYMHEVALHEYLHALADIGDIGFERGLDDRCVDGDSIFLPLEEAFIANATMLASRRRIFNRRLHLGTEIDDRKPRTGPGIDELVFINLLMTHGNKPIDNQLLTDAHFEGWETHRLPARRELRSRIDANYESILPYSYNYPSLIDFLVNYHKSMNFTRDRLLSRTLHIMFRNLAMPNYSAAYDKPDLPYEIYAPSIIIYK